MRDLIITGILAGWIVGYVCHLRRLRHAWKNDQ